MRIRIRAGLAVTTGLALVTVGGLAQAAQASQTAATPARAALPHAATLLYNQDNHPSGYALISQNLGKTNTESAQAADDFTVPNGHTWTIAQVNVGGKQVDGSPATETVFLYKNTVNAKKQDVPGTLVKKETLKGKNNGSGSLVIAGITGVKLAAGHYWVSVQANQTSGEWAWDSRTVQSGSPAAWQNPGNGFATGCTTWTPYESCTGASGRPDLMFALYGSSAG
jgi:hypothetical protein